MRPFAFPEALVRGVIESRPNRFVMMVRHGDAVYRCHCPVTGDIAGLDFGRGGIPCLLSKNTAPKAKTDFTVEAISLDNVNIATANEGQDASWIGINQNRANRYVEHFLRQGGLLGASQEDQTHVDVSVPSRKRKKTKAKTVTNDDDRQATLNSDSETQSETAEVQRERVLGKSKIDFLIGDNHFCEVKSPLGSIPTRDHPNFDPKRKRPNVGITHRLIRHFDDLSLLLETDPTAAASIIIFFMYDAPIFRPPTTDGKKAPAKEKEQYRTVLQASARARAAGVRFWQLNTRITPTHVHFVSHFDLPDL
ncbi:Hypothetical Protein FCC1311_029582 [Hondaea fermentalgiana]|uniref:SfsA N-terminal OB domain-containing protein n=1 Tax=Hondaea fermentalgiana TaxID=2315210 RepID=A0A2R5G6Q6_9STRA|nr:Hypothetical Protein FCC1311_029582 [Hondaea fermentalgiana]|eukprot:GBG26737.1 Hypothetical Protein FCC1311_029582 [Hondaea fermentalgiana]